MGASGWNFFSFQSQGPLKVKPQPFAFIFFRHRMYSVKPPGPAQISQNVSCSLCSATSIEIKQNKTIPKKKLKQITNFSSKVEDFVHVRHLESCPIDEKVSANAFVRIGTRSG
jgi:hypothetical protein